MSCGTFGLKLNEYRPTVAVVDLAALKHNVKELKKKSENSLFMAVVKTNAYGHGAVEVGKAALEAGADRLGVSLVEEGAVLREAGILAPINVLSTVDNAQARDIVNYDLIAAVSSAEFAEQLNNFAGTAGKTVKVHLKIDSGLHRFGVLPEKAAELCNKVYRLPNLIWEGIYTHLSSADEGNWIVTEKQVDVFKSTVEELAILGFEFPIKHVGGSTINIERPDMHFDMVRPGIAIYGYPPAKRQEEIVDLQQVMTIKSKIVHIISLPMNTPVGYSGCYLTRGKTRIATIPIGFGDGLQRALSGKAEVLISGKRFKLAGKISLDQVVVDLDGNEGINIGDEVVIMGKQGNDEITAKEMAARINGIPDQIVATLTQRMPRVYV